MPSSPTGARISGSADGSPRIVVDDRAWRRRRESAAGTGSLQVVEIGTQGLLGIGAAVGVVEERLGYAALVKQTQILDAGDVLHGSSPALPILPVDCPVACLRARQNVDGAAYALLRLMRGQIRARLDAGASASRGLGRGRRAIAGRGPGVSAPQSRPPHQPASGMPALKILWKQKVNGIVPAPW